MTELIETPDSIFFQECDFEPIHHGPFAKVSNMIKQEKLVRYGCSDWVTFWESRLDNRIFAMLYYIDLNGGGFYTCFSIPRKLADLYSRTVWTPCLSEKMMQKAVSNDPPDLLELFILGVSLTIYPHDPKDRVDYLLRTYFKKLEASQLGTLYIDPTNSELWELNQIDVSFDFFKNRPYKVRNNPVFLHRIDNITAQIKYPSAIASIDTEMQRY